jgi:hypothetical protein
VEVIGKREAALARKTEKGKDTARPTEKAKETGMVKVTRMGEASPEEKAAADPIPVDQGTERAARMAETEQGITKETRGRERARARVAAIPMKVGLIQAKETGRYVREIDQLARLQIHSQGDEKKGGKGGTGKGNKVASL